MTTVDDLTRLAMREAQDFRNKMLVTGQSYSPHDEYYVFTRSIVRALRDEIWTRTKRMDACDILLEILGPIEGEGAAKESGGRDRKYGPAWVGGGVPSPTYHISAADWWAAFMNARIVVVHGSDAGEKVAGGSTREDEKAVEAAGDKGPVSVNSPATDAAPAVCVWECGPVPDKKGLVRVTSKCAGFESVRSELVIGRASHNCPSCGKPITFKEANHG